MKAESGVAGLATPWPEPRRWPMARRLLACWRWESERGEDSDAVKNARASLAERTRSLGISVFE